MLLAKFVEWVRSFESLNTNSVRLCLLIDSFNQLSGVYAYCVVGGMIVCAIRMEWDTMKLRLQHMRTSKT